MQTTPSSISHSPHAWPRRRRITASALLVLVTFVAYLPAMRGDFIWDDDAHVTRRQLRSLHGLYLIWFDPSATQQYYPLLHSAFWLEHRLWGDSTLGYHLLNVALHAAAALLVMRIMRRLLTDKFAAWADSAAFLAAALFALHPVYVESVAWITEQKNTLSIVFYLSALLVYLRFDRTRTLRPWLLATLLFVLGLLSKTVIATLPAALLVIFWWLRGRLSWKRDVVPLLPWFLLGAVGGLFTAWVEHELIGAKGRAFDLSAVQRFLLAGRVVWFYLYQLFWPADLIFVYPRWTIDPASAWQWLYPVALAGLLAALMLLARRSRAPLAAFLFFAGSLFPVLGFFNVFPFLYSYVADHFQYVASLGVVALVACGLARAAARFRSPALQSAILLPLPLFFGYLTLQQSRIYVNNQTLYEVTIERNPNCWMAYNNLGLVLKNKGRFEEALTLIQRSLDLYPENPDAIENMGTALNGLGRPEEAIAAYRRALKLRPGNPGALANMANALVSLGRHPEAIECLQQALRLDPRNARLYGNFGAALEAAGRPADAVAAYRRALEIDPQEPGVRSKLDVALAATQSPDRAIAVYEQTIKAEPDNFRARFGLAVALAQLNRVQEAVAQYEQVIRIKPDHVEAHNNLAALLAKNGRLTEALPHFEEGVRLRPAQIETRMNLAVAYANAGRISDSLASARQALEMAQATGRTDMLPQIDGWIESCRKRAAEPAAP